VYAVPGELLRRGADAYRRIAASGGEFLNHGHADHTVLGPDGRLTDDSLFYDQIGHARIRADVEAGDRDVREVLGISPRGFRTPHFGTFQRADQLRFLHGVLEELEYRYSSSTVPLWALRFGPSFLRLGLPEFPVTGRGSAPLEILDSWGYFASPDRIATPAEYAAEAIESARLHLAYGPGLLNLYADPSHVHDRPEFFDAVRRLLELAPSVTFSELLDELMV
jgi:peptidoglycan/xylan/chitin deacetylase (PgdA/CDA1 family)